MFKISLLVGVIAAIMIMGTAPAVMGAAKSGTDSGKFYYNYPSEAQREYDLPGNRRLHGQTALGFVVTDNEESPLYTAAVTMRGGKVVKLDGHGNYVGLIFEYQFLEIKDGDGDIVFVLAQLDPPGDVSARIVRGSGKYAGITGGGSLNFRPSDVWPDGSAALEYTLNWEILDQPAPPEIRQPSRAKPMAASPIVDLPAPDSPISPSTSPRRRVTSTPCTISCHSSSAWPSMRSPRMVRRTSPFFGVSSCALIPSTRSSCGGTSQPRNSRPRSRGQWPPPGSAA